jgi:hypothetical protein
MIWLAAVTVATTWLRKKKHCIIDVMEKNDKINRFKLASDCCRAVANCKDADPNDIVALRSLYQLLGMSGEMKR